MAHNPTKKNIIDPNDGQRDNNKRDPKDGPYHAYNNKPGGSKDRSPGRKRKRNDYSDSEPEDSEEEEESDTSSNSEGDDSESSSPASSDDSDDNDEGSSDNEEFFKGTSPPRKRRRTTERRFNPKSKEEKSSWKLSNSQAKYTVKNFNSYVSEKTLRESILEKQPVPRNIGEPKELDGFMRDLLYDARKNFTLDSDKKLRKIQSKVYEVMGPLGSLWKKISKAKKKGGTAVSGGDIIRTLDQSVILLGQVNNSLNFLRRSLA